MAALECWHPVSLMDAANMAMPARIWYKSSSESVSQLVSQLVNRRIVGQWVSRSVSKWVG